MNMGVQVSLQDPAFNPLGYTPRSGVAGSYYLLFINEETKVQRS